MPFWPVTMSVVLTPLNATTVGLLLRFAPKIATGVPTLPLMGVKLSMIGARVTMKLSALEPAPNELVTVIGPLLVAPKGTLALSWFPDRIPQVAGLPLIETPVVLVKLIPSMV